MTDPESSDAVRGLENWAAQLQQKASRYGELQSALNELRVEHTSKDGKVRVEVDSNGVPTEIALTERARGTDPTELTSTINSTLHTAQTELRGRVENLAGEIVGDDAPANNIVSQYQNRFPDPEPEPSAGTDPPEIRIGALDEGEAHEPESEASAPQDNGPRTEPDRHQRRRTRDDDDDDDWSGRSIFE